MQEKMNLVHFVSYEGFGRLNTVEEVSVNVCRKSVNRSNNRMLGVSDTKRVKPRKRKRESMWKCSNVGNKR